MLIGRTVEVSHGCVSGGLLSAVRDAGVERGLCHCSGRIQVLPAMSLPEQGLAVVDPNSSQQTDQMAVAAHCQRICFQLLSADKKRAIIGKLTERVAAGELRRHGEHVPRGRRVPAGVGEGAYARFARGEQPATRSCSHGAIVSMRFVV